jgi:chromosome segregation ATPase
MNAIDTQPQQENPKPITALDRAEQAIKDAEKDYHEALGRRHKLVPEERRLVSELAKAEAELNRSDSADPVKEAMAKVEPIRTELAVIKQLMTNAQSQSDIREKHLQNARYSKERLVEEATRLRNSIKNQRQNIGYNQKDLDQAQEAVNTMRVMVAAKRSELDAAIQSLKDMTGEDKP